MSESNAAQIARGLSKAGRKVDHFLHAASFEDAVCPHCETWLASECLRGAGCPTPDGVNGEKLRKINPSA